MSAIAVCLRAYRFTSCLGQGNSVRIKSWDIRLIVFAEIVFFFRFIEFIRRKSVKRLGDGGTVTYCKSTASNGITAVGRRKVFFCVIASHIHLVIVRWLSIFKTASTFHAELESILIFGSASSTDH